MARGHLVFALSVILSFRCIKDCLLNSSYILAWICMKLGRDVAPQVQKCMWGDNSCLTNLAELWSLTLRIFTHFSLSSQLLLHPCMDLNETWQGCCTTSVELHCGEIIHVRQILTELWSLTLTIFTYFS